LVMFCKAEGNPVPVITWFKVSRMWTELECQTDLCIQMHSGKCLEFNKIHWSVKFNFFFGTRGKISVSNRTFNTEFKYESSFSPSPTVFLWQPS
jgi:hypothetical protein